MLGTLCVTIKKIGTAKKVLKSHEPKKEIQQLLGPPDIDNRKCPKCGGTMTYRRIKHTKPAMTALRYYALEPPQCAA